MAPFSVRRHGGPVTIVWLLVGLAIVAWAVFVFNRLVRLRNQVRSAWADIDVQLKRRHDLVPDLVATRIVREPAPSWPTRPRRGWAKPVKTLGLGWAGLAAETPVGGLLINRLKGK